MVGHIKLMAATLAAATLLAGCTEQSQVNRARTLQEIGSTQALTPMTREFYAAAPYIVYFGFDSAELTAEARKTLDAQIAWIRAHPGVRLGIFGHTDAVGPESYNQALGLERAKAVMDYFLQSGISPRQIRDLTSLGEAAPILFAPGPQEVNRRVTTYVAGFHEAKPRETRRKPKTKRVVIPKKPDPCARFVAAPDPCGSSNSGPSA